MSKLSFKSVLIGVAVGALLFASAPVIADIGDPVIQGQSNVAHARTTMRGVAPGAVLRLIQQKPGVEALSVFTEPGDAPFKVNRRARVENLNADLLDGRHRGFFEPRVPQPGTVMIGSFSAASGASTGNLLDDVSFPNELQYAIPQSNITYIDYNAAFTADCPAFGQAAEGHLCIYATWNNNTTFNLIGGVDQDLNNQGTATFGFAIYWNAAGNAPNVRGHWVHTVPSSPPVVAGSPSRDAAETTETGLIGGS